MLLTLRRSDNPVADIQNTDMSSVSMQKFNLFPHGHGWSSNIGPFDLFSVEISFPKEHFS